MAADLRGSGEAGGPTAESTCRRYAASIEALRPRFDIYERANAVNAHPWLVDLLVWSARRNPGRLQRMSGVLEETHVPGNLITPRGLARLLLGR